MKVTETESKFLRLALASPSPYYELTVITENQM